MGSAEGDAPPALECFPGEEEGVRLRALWVMAMGGFVAAATPLAGQEGGGGPDLVITSDAVELDFGGRLQLQASTSPCSEFPFEAGSSCVEQSPAVDMFVRRARLAMEIRISELLDAKIQPEFGSIDQVELKDAWGRLSFHPAFRIKMGHFKRPFDGFQMTSSTQILTIERDLDLPGVPATVAASLDEFTTRFRVSDRDVGAMVHGTAPGTGFEYWLGVFNGRGPSDDSDVNSAKQVVGRARYSITVGPSLPLAVAVAAASTDLPFGGPDDQPGATISGERYGNYELWAELGDFAPGPHVQLGMVLGDNPLQDELGGTPDPAAPADVDFAEMRAWQAIGAYRLRIGGTDLVESVEPAFRVTRAEPDTELDDDEVWGFTPGVNLYFHGRNRLMLNLDVVSFGDDGLDSTSSFKAQFQAHF